MLRNLLRALLGVIIVAIVLIVGFWLWARQPSIAAIAPPDASTFDKATIARGANLVAMGDCATCHNSPEGHPFAGGFPVPTPFGIIYGTNITPDPDTGIGRWSEQAFARAMHRGIRRDGAYLYPAFPYTHFTKVSDDDIKAIYAYLMTRPAVHNVVPAPRLPFPLNIRPIMAGWNLLFFRPGRFVPDPAKSEAWNRGAYIAEGLAHCGACHTPRNLLGAEKTSERYAGGEAEGWFAPALGARSSAPVQWSEAALLNYLSAGFARDHGVAAGPMAGVTRDLRKLPASDLTALATYFASLAPPAPARETMGAASTDKASYQIATAQAMGQKGPAKTGEAIFAGACASCHFEGGSQPFHRPIRLRLSSAVTAPTPRNFIQIVLGGIQPPPGDHGRWMPPFANALTDEQVSLLAQYVRGHFSGKPDWSDIGKTVAQVRKGSGS
ncbi:MAG TPA: cytochrome c [Pseudolabrys sp.]|nr:cytochrome c [Pseudolabrys sp.]